MYTDKKITQKKICTHFQPIPSLW